MQARMVAHANIESAAVNQHLMETNRSDRNAACAAEAFLLTKQGEGKKLQSLELELARVGVAPEPWRWRWFRFGSRHHAPSLQCIIH